MFVHASFTQKIPFFVALSKNVKFQTTAGVKDRKIESSQECLQRAFSTHDKKKIVIQEIRAELEFKLLKIG